VTMVPSSPQVTPVQEQGGSWATQPWNWLAALNSGQFSTALRSCSSVCTAEGRYGKAQHEISG
jgi:hypothetical protein